MSPSPIDETAATVRCYAGYTYPERPQSFDWQGRTYDVARLISTRRILETGSGALLTTFSVVTADGQRFRLTYDDKREQWTATANRER